MNQNKYMKYLKLIAPILLILISFSSFSNVELETNSVATKVVITKLPFSLENLDYVLQQYEVLHRDIVIKQFILETGWGKSYNFKKRNNLFGLYDSRKHAYFEFTHWTESVKGYRDLVQFKYKGGDYYKFLKELGYAEDPGYINKLKKIKYDI